MSDMKDNPIVQAKLAVGIAAFGLCAETDAELFRRLEELYWKGFKAGAASISDPLIDSINEHFSEPLDP